MARETYFVILDRNPRKVWHYIRREWCFDIDAEYGNGFEYASIYTASNRQRILSRDPKNFCVDVVTRDQLFEMLDVKDWAGRSR